MLNRNGIVWRNDELRGKNIEAKRDITEELRQEWWRKSFEWRRAVCERRRSCEWLRNSTVAIGFAEEPD